MSILSVNGLYKRYPSFSLEDVSFCVESGSIMGFIGRNGAGKTTTLKSILGLVHPDAGTIRYFGMDFSEHEAEIKQRIGYVVSASGHYKKKKIRTITDVTRRFYPNWSEADYRHYLEVFHLDEDKTPDQLSEGMKLKYSISLALSHAAELLILDEPTSGLDPVSRGELLDVFTQLRGRGTAILFSTHITSDLEKCADAITYIKSGKLLFTGPKKDLGCGVEEYMIRNEKEDLHV